MRNMEKDEAEMSLRREKMLETGFSLFSEHSIEAVSMQDVAKGCGLGVATLYRYFSSKIVFVIAIASRQWDKFFSEIEEEYAKLGGSLMNAAEELDFYLGCYIVLYRKHRDILRFNQNFNSFISHESPPPELLLPYRESVDRFARKFHHLYLKGKNDCTIRTDLPEEKMFVSTMHMMLAVSARFAEGVVYGTDEASDLTEELLLLKRMLLTQFTAR